jgi:hypothetical protein
LNVKAKLFFEVALCKSKRSFSVYGDWQTLTICNGKANCPLGHACELGEYASAIFVEMAV